MRLISISDKRIPAFLILSGLSLDMGGDLGLRKYFLAAALLFYFFHRSFSFPRHSLYFFVILCLYPTVLLFFSVVGENNFDIAVSQYSGTLFGFIVIVLLYQSRQSDLIWIYFRALQIVATLAIILAAGLVFDINFIKGVVVKLSETTGGYFGIRSLGSEQTYANIYFKSTLFYPSGFILSIYYRKQISALIFLLACIVSFSKVGVAMCLLAMVVSILIDKDFRKSGSALLWGIIITFTILYSPIVIDIERVFFGESETGMIRKLHMISLLDLLQDDVFSLLFGFGLGHQFYSLGAGEIIHNIEIDHFNTIRKYGLIWFLISLYLLIKLIKFSTIRIVGSLYSKYVTLALVTTFFAAGTNPVLISPLFFALVGVIYANASRRLDYA